jgi:putative tryptophan/tyrosine transport system substrate-binding protein
MPNMKRREFITLLGGAAAAWPLAARAQQTKVPTIGVLVLGNPDPASFLKAFREGLQKVGYIEGQNIRLEFRSAGGKVSLIPEAATELVRLKVGIIVAWQTPAITAAKQATNDIPIVMASAGDPVGTGLIASLSRPGGNVTGTASFGPELAAKNIELIRDVLPSARRVAVLANATDPFTKPFLAHIELAARTLAIEIAPIMLRPGEEFDAAFEDMRREQVDAVFIQPSLLRKGPVDLALKHRLPSFSINRLLPATGGLMSYSLNFAHVIYESAVYVDKILKGSKPVDLPVAQPTKFELTINLKTAKVLGLTVPPTVLARADEVIE